MIALSFFLIWCAASGVHSLDMCFSTRILRYTIANVSKKNRRPLMRYSLKHTHIQCHSLLLQESAKQTHRKFVRATYYEIFIIIACIMMLHNIPLELI